MGICIAQRPIVPDLDGPEPIKTAHECILHFKRNRQYPEDINVLKRQAEKFKEINRDLDETIAEIYQERREAPHVPLSSEWEEKINRLIDKWRFQCSQLYEHNRWLPHTLREITDEENFVLGAIDKVDESALPFRDVDYKEERFVNAARETAEGFRAAVLGTTLEAFKHAAKFGQRLGIMVPVEEIPGNVRFENLKLDVAPIVKPGIRFANYYEIAWETVVLTAKKTYDFLWDNKLLLPTLFSLGVVASQTDLYGALRPTVELMAEGAKLSTSLFADAIPSIADAGLNVFESRIRPFFTPFWGVVATSTWALPKAISAGWNEQYLKMSGIAALGLMVSLAPYYVAPGFVQNHMVGLLVGCGITGTLGAIAKIAARNLREADYPEAKNFLSVIGNVAFIGSVLVGNLAAGHYAYKVTIIAPPTPENPNPQPQSVIRSLITANPSLSLAVAAGEALVYAYLTDSKVMKAAAGVLMTAAAGKQYGLAAAMAAASLSLGAFVSNFINGLREQQARDPEEHPPVMVDGPNPRRPASYGYTRGAATALAGLVFAAITHIGAKNIQGFYREFVSQITSSAATHPLAAAAAAVGTAALGIGTAIGIGTGLITQERVKNAAKAIGRGAVSGYTTGAAALIAGAAAVGTIPERHKWVGVLGLGVFLINGSYQLGRQVIARCARR